MRIRMPQKIEDDLRFCSEEFKISYPKIGQRALKCFHNTNLDLNDIKQPKEKLSNEGYEFGDKPFCYTTDDFRNIIIWYVNQSMENHNKNYVPLQLDDYTFETDEQQLLIQMAVDNAKRDAVVIIEEMREEYYMTGSVDYEYYINKIKEI